MMTLVVVAAEDDAMVSLITDVSMVQQIGKTFRLDGQQFCIRRFGWPGSEERRRLISLTTR